MTGLANAADHRAQPNPHQTAGRRRAGWMDPWRRARLLALAGVAVCVTQAWAQSTTPGSEPPKATEPAAAPAPATPDTLSVEDEAKKLGEDARTEETRSEREVELLLKNAQRVTGVLVDANKDEFVLRIRGVNTKFATSDVAKVTQLPTVEERYAAIRAATADDDVDGLLRLSRWLLERQRYTLAMREVDRVLGLEPNNAQAKDLKKLLSEQSKIEAASRNRAKPKPAEPDKAEPDEDPTLPVRPQTSTQRKRLEFPLLSTDQINLMRVYETDLKDPPTMFITRGTVEKFLDKYAGTIVEGRGVVPTSPEAREKFLRQSAADVLSWFFDLRAREFYDQVEVKSDPKSMTNFRENVHSTWLINSCATTQCHGGQEAGRFYLYNREKNTTRATYTNFYIIENFRTVGGGALIDYQNPARSPLLQMGLPRDKAVVRHPEVGQPGRRWKPVFDSPDDPKFRRAVEWIVSMYPNRSKYPIDYTPPVPTPLQGTSGAGVRPGGNQVPGAPEPAPAEKKPDPIEKPPQPR